MTLLNTENAVETINGLLSKSAESFYEIGTVLKNLKEQIASFEKDSDKKGAEHEYALMLEKLPFGKKVADKLIQIAKNEAIGANLDIMPHAYNTLYALIAYDAEDMPKFRELGLNAFTTMKELSAMRVAISGESVQSDDTQQDEVIDGILNKGKKSTGDFSELKVDADDDDGVVLKNYEFINVTIDKTKLSAFEVSKVKDLVSFIEKLNFTEAKGVTVDGCNPNILSDAPPVKIAA